MNPFPNADMRDFHAYQAGKFKAQRDDWMFSARLFRDRNSHQAMSEAAQTARRRNHEYLRALADWRKARGGK